MPLSQYNYSFPQSLIAQHPASPRDSARLLVYKKNDSSASYDTFKNISKYLPPKSILVFNKTKVIPARLTLKKESGGEVQILYLSHNNLSIEALANKKLKLGSKLFLNTKKYFTVLDIQFGHYFLKPSFNINKIQAVLNKYGETPIPPYIKHSPLSEKKLRSEYQAVFAKNIGSVAAPTASLHFTKTLLDCLKKDGHMIKFITLHVGLGTFAKVTEENIKNKSLHNEFYSIDKSTAKFLNKAKKQNRKIIAVGTTSVRTLESASNESGELINLSGLTNLFIQENYKFKFVDGIITNFHVPQSSLLMLVSAFIGKEKLLSLYNEAIERKFRLFSFGDGMLIL